MAPEVGFSSTSPESDADEDNSTDADDNSSDSDEYVYIGTGATPRPPTSLSFAIGSMSKSLPSRLAGGIVSQAYGPGARSHSAHRPSAWQHQRTSAHPPHPPRPPPRPPPPLSCPVSSPPSPLSVKHDNPHRAFAELQYGRDGRSYGNGGDSPSSSLRDSREPEVEAGRQSDGVRRLREHYVGLRDKGSSLLAKFNTARAQRARVQSLQQSKDEADKAFVDTARALLPDSAQLRQLRQLFETMHQTHLGYREAELRLKEVVDELQQSQEDLISQEAVFYKTAIDALGPVLSTVDKNQCSPTTTEEDDYLRGISGDRPEAVHPLYGMLRKAFSELQLAKELLSNTRMKREALHARKTIALTEDTLELLEQYSDAGRKKALELRDMTIMTQDDLEQLGEYDVLEQEAHQDIERYAVQVISLQEQCRENGVLPSSYFQLEGLGLDPFYRDEIRLAPSPFDSNNESATLAHPVFPLLLSNPTHLLHGFPQTSLQALRKALQLPVNALVRDRQVREAAREVNMQSLLASAETEDKSEYINRWLLHKLHHSAMEAELLWTTFRSRLKILDIDRWQRDVLSFWWRDGLAEPMSLDSTDNGTNRPAKLIHLEFNKLSRSESGQLEGLRGWKLDDSWL